MKVCSLYKNWFSVEDCDYITRYADKILDVKEATVGRDKKETIHKTRKSQTGFITKNGLANSELWYFVSSKLVDIITDANKKVYGFSISGIDAIQYTVYSNAGDHYSWHTDTFFDQSPFQRKLSVTLQLTDPSTYKGGDFELLQRHEYSLEELRQKGNVLVFPSFLSHRVTPVIEGERKSIVAWFDGRRFQ